MKYLFASTPEYSCNLGSTYDSAHSGRPHGLLAGFAQDSFRCTGWKSDFDARFRKGFAGRRSGDFGSALRASRGRHVARFHERKAFVCSFESGVREHVDYTNVERHGPVRPQ